MNIDEYNAEKKKKQKEDALFDVLKLLSEKTEIDYTPLLEKLTSKEISLDRVIAAIKEIPKPNFDVSPVVGAIKNIPKPKETVVNVPEIKPDITAHNILKEILEELKKKRKREIADKKKQSKYNALILKLKENIEEIEKSIDKEIQIAVQHKQEIDLSGYIPYTGATDDVDLGTHALTADTINATTLLNILSSLTVGGTTTGQSTIARGLVVNDSGGNTVEDGLRVETGSEENAFLVDAVSDKVELNVDSQLDETKAFYFGDSTTDGSWRIIRSGDNLNFQRRVSGSWVDKSVITG